MRLMNAKVFLDGVFIRGGVDFNERFTAVGSSVQEGIDLGGLYLIPGLVDIHTHAALGGDASDGDSVGLVRMSEFYASRGVTSWCPTTVTLGEADLLHALHKIRDFSRPSDGAKAVGVNLEGPFLSYAKRGAQNPDYLHTPDTEMFHRLNQAAGDNIRLITVAPEEPGAMAFIREVSRYCTVSVGHTAADYDTAMAAFAAGATHVTHLFNAMPPLGHRAPGVVGAAMDAGATVELIPDGLHIHPSVVRLTQRLFGERLVFISDSLRCAGMPDGDYALGGQSVTLKDGKATLSGTDTLAGSAIHLMDGLKLAVSFGVPLEKAVTAATSAPAQVIGRQEIGSIAPGKCADFVLLDAALEPQAVFIDGKQVAGKKLEERRFTRR